MTFRPRRSAHADDPTTGWGFVGLLLLTGIAPMAIDIYNPSLPEVATDLGASASAVQLTISGFLLGMALGQLLIGPVSDSLGRRRLVIAGEVLCLLATIGCATAPTVEVLIAARVLQGVSGSIGVAIAKAIIADVTSGARTGKLLATMMAIMGLAPVIAPVIGSFLATLAGWRSVFWMLTVVLAANVVILFWCVPETLPAHRRRPATVGGVVRSVTTVLTRRHYVGYLLARACGGGVFFAYLSASPFILQVQHGFSPIEFGLTFAAGSVLMTASVTVAGRMVGRVDTRRILAVGLSGLLAAGMVFFGGALLDMPLWAFLPGIVVLTISNGQIPPTATTLVLNECRDVAGTGSSVLGSAQFLIAAAVAPLVGVAGADNPMPFGLLTLGCGTLALLTFALLTRPRGHGSAAQPGE